MKGKVPFARILGMLLLGPVALCGSLVMTGSDLFDQQLQQALARQLENRGVSVEMRFNGSLLGLRDLASGEAGAGLLAIRDGEELPDGLRAYPVAFQVVTLAVHAEAPVRELSYRQLREIFEENSDLANWSGLTDEPAWRDRKISLLASRRDNSLAIELFNAQAMMSSRFRASVRFEPIPPEALIQRIAEDASIMVLLPVHEVEPPARLLSIKRGEADQAYTPSPDNIFFGDYPLRLPFYLLAAEDLDPVVLSALVQSVLSPEVTAALQRQYLVTLPEQERRDLLNRFE